MLRLLPLMVLGPSLMAQVPGPDPGKRIMSGVSRYTSRASIPGSVSGRLAQHLPTGYWAGIRGLTAFQFMAQDQDAATVQTLRFEVRRQDPSTGFPDWPANPNAPLLSIALTPPPGTGIQAWQFTVTPAQTLRVTGDEPLYLVWLVPPDALWPADGVSIHMNPGLPTRSCGGPAQPSCCNQLRYEPGEAARNPGNQTTVNIENLAPVDTLAGTLAYAGLDLSWVHWVVADAPVLQKLAVDPTYFCPQASPHTGHAAMDPDLVDVNREARHDDYGWRVRAGAAFANGLAVVFLSDSALDRPVVTAFGDLWIDPTAARFALFPQVVALGGTGVGDAVLALGAPGAPERVLMAGFGNLHSQAVVLDASLRSVRLTNLDVHRTVLAGGTAFAITAATPVSFNLGAGRTLLVQNDGNGDVTAEFLHVSGAVLGTLLVRERTTGITQGLRGGIPPGTVQARLRTANQDPFANNPTRGLWRLQ